MAGTEDKGNARLMRALLGVTIGATLLAIVPQILNRYYGTHVDLGIWAFLAMAAAGMVGTLVHSLGIGSAFGAFCGAVISLVGGVAFFFLDPVSPGADWRSILSGIAILAVLGLGLGLLGGLPVWTFRKLYKKGAPAR
jgi:hypothetical protein